MLLKVLDDAPGYGKYSLQGPQGAGKSRTAVEIACETHRYFQSKKPIAFFDTETGSDYLWQLIQERTGMAPIRIKTRAFSQLLEATDECVRGAADILIVDSITHVWREIQSAHMARVNEHLRFKKTRMDIQDIMRIKEEWAPWPDLFLNSPLHVIVCGREGNEWGHEEDEDTGKRELVAVGKKMKVEGEFGYEASLMISMHAEQVDPLTLRRTEQEQLPPKAGETKRRTKKKVVLTKQPRRIINVATVLKDRFDIMNGLRFEMPTGKHFLPFIEQLKPANHVPVDTRVQSTESLPEMDGSYVRVKTDREISIEKIQAELLRAYPSQSAVDKKAKGDALQEYFQTRSWTEVEKRLSADVLEDGLKRLTAFVDSLEAMKRQKVSAQEEANSTFEMVTGFESSFILQYGYDAENKLLAVDFKAGNRSVYVDVPPEIFAAMQQAESVGKFLNSEIKKTYRLADEGGDEPKPKPRRKATPADTNGSSAGAQFDQAAAAISDTTEPLAGLSN